MRPRRKWIGWIAAGIALLAVTPSYVRAYRVGGTSDAPTYLLDDLVLVNKAAYDVRLPFAGTALVSHADPERGEMVWFAVPGDGAMVFKRVIGIPGDRVEMRDNHLTVNGVALRYETAALSLDDEVASRNRLGSVLEREKGGGPAHPISFTPGAGVSGTFGPVIVPEGHYFLLGDNRWRSLDSREYGPVPRSAILGRLSRPFR